MLIEKKREADLARRKGHSWRTIIMIIFLGLVGVVSYYIITYAFEIEFLRYRLFYTELALPRSLPEWVIRVGLSLLSVGVTWFCFTLGFIMTSKQGRIRAGKASPYSSNPDPLDRKYFH